MIAETFTTIYIPRLERYVVERPGVRVMPTLDERLGRRPTDPYGMVRAFRLCKALNRVYGAQTNEVT